MSKHDKTTKAISIEWSTTVSEEGADGREIVRHTISGTATSAVGAAFLSKHAADTLLGRDTPGPSGPDKEPDGAKSDTKPEQTAGGKSARTT